MITFSSTPNSRHQSALLGAPNALGYALNRAFLGVAFALPISAFAETESSEVASSRPFNTTFLQGGGAGIDLNEFLQGSSVVPGSYRVDINVNRSLVGRQDVLFQKNAKTGRVQACLTLGTLESLGLDGKALGMPVEGDNPQPDTCVDLPSLIEQSSVEYDANRQQLNISVPQAAMSRSARGYVDPALWDEGVTAGFVDYNFSGRRNGRDGVNTDAYYIGMRNGINLGAWRLRNESTITSNTDSDTEFRSDRTFAQRDITSLKSQLTLGNAYSNARTFDSVRMNGILLESDDAMLPDSQRGYAPTVQGDAETNATVEIRQNGYLLYSTNVSPGPFVIDDIYPNGSNGDLEVTVIEADGRKRVFTQAFASLPQMVRKGMLRHSFAAGQYDSNYSGDESPSLAMGSLAYGLTDSTTLLGGLQWAMDFSAANLGVTQNTPVGAFSLDVTQSDSTALNQRNTGQSVRLLYAKTLSSTDTTLTLASYRYSTEGYRTLSEHVTDLRKVESEYVRGRAKSRFDLTVNQTLGDRKNGSLYLTIGEQRFWNLQGKSQQYRFGYSGAWNSLSYDINASHTLNPGSSYENEDLTRLTLSLSFPLGSGSRSPRSRSTLSYDNTGEHSISSGINGSVMGRNDAFYSVTAGHESLTGATASATLSGVTPVARLNAGYTQGDHYNSISVGASGSVVAHAGGINLGQPVGETFSLVEVPGSSGVGLSSHVGVTTGVNGFAVVPNAQPYRNNWVNLNAGDLGADVEILNPTQQLIPRRGSITVAKFEAKKGRRVQFELVHANGSKLPFGARVKSAHGSQMAITDPTGNALVLVDDVQGVLKVTTSGKVCSAPYSLPEKSSSHGYDRVKIICQ